MNFKDEKGITMISLILAIVIMSILAAISISSTIDDNGIVKQTKKGVIEASIREVEEALEVKLLLKEKEEIKKGNLERLTISDLKDTNVVTEKESNKLINPKYYNVYTIDIEKIDVKSDYGKGSSKDVFEVYVELDENEGNETPNYKVYYIDKSGTRH